MYRTIVVGYDGSTAARKAFDAALELAARDHAELHVVSVGRPSEIADDVETEAVIEHTRAYHRRLLAELKASAATKQVKTHYEVAVGHPAEQIIYYADRIGADLIVVGDRGRSNFARLLLGSVSKQVTEHAGRPVLVVR
ncbi:MAG TPA: universal stress protein [Burkholderiales bacterium]|jgi:nucleotide-binding universal stress UspA family protein|nr:universal stress protein [Burkholderiales bacterium]HET9350772.1 universal stress protein [Burkholderiales bacterium]